MNKTLLGIASCLLLTQITPAMADTTIEFRSAAFFPMNHRFRDIYGTVGADYEFEIRTTVFCCMEGWANFTWYPKHGSVGHCCGSSDLNIANFSFGLMKSCSVCDCFRFYAGIGPVFGGVWVHNKLRSCTGLAKKKNKDAAFAVGGMVKTGILYYFTCNLFLDLFVDYFYEPAFFHRHVDVGGVRTGLGLGVAF